MTLALERSYVSEPNAFLYGDQTPPPECALNDPNGSVEPHQGAKKDIALDAQSIEILAEAYDPNTAPERVAVLMRQAFAACIVSGREAFDAVSDAYGNRPIYGIEELASSLGKTVVGQGCSVATSPTASFRTLVNPQTR